MVLLIVLKQIPTHGVGPTGDPVSLGTAYLYYQWGEMKDYARST